MLGKNAPRTCLYTVQAMTTRLVPAGSRIMKLIIQIPCFNEAETLPLTLRLTARLAGHRRDREPGDR